MKEPLDIDSLPDDFIVEAPVPRNGSFIREQFRYDNRGRMQQASTSLEYDDEKGTGERPMQRFTVGELKAIARAVVDKLIKDGEF